MRSSGIIDIVPDRESFGLTVNGADSLVCAADAKLTLAELHALELQDVVILPVTHNRYLEGARPQVERLLRGSSGRGFDVDLDLAANPLGVELWRH